MTNEEIQQKATELMNYALLEHNFNRAAEFAEIIQELKSALEQAQAEINRRDQEEIEFLTEAQKLADQLKAENERYRKTLKGLANLSSKSTPSYGWEFRKIALKALEETKCP